MHEEGGVIRQLAWDVLIGLCATASALLIPFVVMTGTPFVRTVVWAVTFLFAVDVWVRYRRATGRRGDPGRAGRAARARRLPHPLRRRFFGEIALFLGQPRTAGALTYCDLYRLGEDLFEHVLTDFPEVGAKIEARARERRREEEPVGGKR